MTTSRPQIMGILNCTPDSFYDGGTALDVATRVAKGVRLIAEGAAIIDVGGESTRPGSSPISADEEIARVAPVVKKLRSYTRLPISIDTYRAAVAEAALQAGATIINDIFAGERDPQMFAVAKKYAAPVVIMHCQGEPRTMQQAPVYADVVREVIDYLHARRRAARAAGVGQVIVDPGFGFGKTVEHNWTLFNALGEICAEFHRENAPVLIGVSNKNMLGGDPRDRVAKSVEAAVRAAQLGADIVRVHNIAETRTAINN
ncbi:MAG: dihydropteroate synthase [Planctomycetota bacterium]|nr:dihydropteroate synthase [Planctomycetota bacterium]